MSNLEFIIYPPLNPVAFNIFDYPVRFYGLIISFGLVIGFILIYNLLNKFYSKSEAEKFVDYVLFLVIFSIIGARLFYVLGSLSFYSANPLEIILINHGGISIWGAIIFGISGLAILSKINKFSFFKHASVFAVALPLCQSIGRWGNYFNQEAFGAPSNVFLKLFVDKIYRPQEFIDISYFHPAFLYESILDFIIFIILIFTFNKNKPERTLYLYLILYSIARIIVETIRIDSVLTVYHVPVAVIISVIVLVISSFCFIFSIKKPQ